MIRPNINNIKQVTLVDSVERSIIAYIKENNLDVGAVLPSEQELSVSLGVARSVLREALSRLKMLGVIETRTRKGMIIKEPSLFEPLKKIIEMNILSDKAMTEILGLRIALELGMVDDIFEHVTDRHIEELTRIVNVGAVLSDNEYENVNEFEFHSKLYEITGNNALRSFQEIVHPMIDFIKSKFEVSFKPINRKLKEEGLIVTHSDLLTYLKFRDKEGFRRSLENHFLVYRIFMNGRS